MRETALHRWVGNHKDHRALRRVDQGLFAAHHLLNWAHGDIRSSGETHLLRALGPRLLTVFDVGAHDGTWTAELLRAAPGCRVHCFEPSPAACAALKQRVGDDERVTITAAALHAAAGRAPLKEYPGAPHLSSLVDYPHALEHRWAEVPLLTGDEYADGAAVGRIDLLKVDTDGSEWDVLDGFAHRLESGSIGAVQFEYGRVNIVVRRLLADFAERFESARYDLFRIRRHGIEPFGYTFDDENFFVANFVAIHRDRRDLTIAAAARCKRSA